MICFSRMGDFYFEKVETFDRQIFGVIGRNELYLFEENIVAVQRCLLIGNRGDLFELYEVKQDETGLSPLKSNLQPTTYLPNLSVEHSLSSMSYVEGNTPMCSC